MRTREEINKDIEELEYKYNKSRNVVDRARFNAQIKEFKLELEKLDSVKLDKKFVYQNDAPSIADHNTKDERREIGRGDITNVDSAFVGII